MSLSDTTLRDPIEEALSERGLGHLTDAVLQIARVESGLDPNAEASTSSATGLFQFIRSTWEEHGEGDRKDPQAQVEAMASLVESNASAFENNIGRQPDEAELYLAHFGGVGRAIDVAQMRANGEGDAPVSDIMSQAAIKANAGIRHNGKSFANFTVDDFYSWSAHQMGELVATGTAQNRETAERNEEESRRRRDAQIANAGMDMSDIFGLILGAMILTAVGKGDLAQQVLQTAFNAGSRSRSVSRYGERSGNPDFEGADGEQYEAPTDERYQSRSAPTDYVDVSSVPYIDALPAEVTRSANDSGWVLFASATDWGREEASGHAMAQGVMIARNLETGEERRFAMMTGGNGSYENHRNGPSPGFVSHDYHNDPDINAVYRVNSEDFSDHRGTGFQDINGESWFIHLMNPIEGKRTEIGIHPDGGQQGTRGCWGVHPNQAAQFKAFWQEVGGFQQIAVLDPSVLRQATGHARMTGYGRFEPENRTPEQQARAIGDALNTPVTPSEPSETTPGIAPDVLSSFTPNTTLTDRLNSLSI